MIEARTHTRTFTVLPIAAVVLLAACKPPPGADEVEELLKQHQYVAAQARLRQELNRSPKSELLWRLRLRLSFAQGRRGEAVEAYRERVLNYGEDADLLRSLSLGIVSLTLESRVPEERLAAIQAARETDAPELETVVAARLTDPDPVVRTWAAVALSGRPDGAAILGEQLQATDARAREIAVRELGRLAGAASLGALLQAAADRDPRVRGAAAATLATIRKTQARDALRGLLYDTDQGVRASAARAVESAKAVDLTPALRVLATDPHLSVRLSAVSALQSVGGHEARRNFGVLATSQDLFIALRAGLALAESGDLQPVLNAVARALVDKDWTVRVAACTTASRLHHRVGLQLVEKALRDPEPRVRLAAARALLAGHADRHEPAVLVGLSIQQLSCDKLASPETAALCVDASDLLVRAGRGEGMEMLKRIARHGTTSTLRLSALRDALLLAPDRNLALDAMADADARVALLAASWAWRHAK